MEKKETHGGARPRAGRKPIPDELKRKQRNYYLNEAENEKVKAYIESLRK